MKRSGLHLCVSVIILVLFSACGTAPTSTESAPSAPTSTSTNLPPTRTPEPSTTRTIEPSATLTTLPGPTTVPTKVISPSGDLVVPLVEGMILQEAIQILESAGFETTTTYRTFQDAPLGDIVEQRPPAETELEAGSIVRLFVSAKVVAVEVVSGLEVAANSQYSYAVDLQAGIPYNFYTSDTYNITDNVDWTELFNCCGRMALSPARITNANMPGLVYTPESDGSFNVIIHNNNPVRFSFTLWITFFSIEE
ncbi:MAG: PASTA domain-containing protein [Chloroflexi bacterium]|nr:PASTA domain-containing protein [Chloroflexota bacterium]